MKRYKISGELKNVEMISLMPTLVGIWAEADAGYDYEISEKHFVPRPTLLQYTRNDWRTFLRHRNS